MGGDQHTVAALGHIYGAMGRRAEAEKILQDLELRSKSQHVSPYLIATIYAGLGDKDRAFAFLEEAYLAKSWDVVENIKSDCGLIICVAISAFRYCRRDSPFRGNRFARERARMAAVAPDAIICAPLSGDSRLPGESIPCHSQPR